MQREYFSPLFAMFCNGFLFIFTTQGGPTWRLSRSRRWQKCTYRAMTTINSLRRDRGMLYGHILFLFYFIFNFNFLFFLSCDDDYPRAVLLLEVCRTVLFLEVAVFGRMPNGAVFWRVCRTRKE